MNLRIGDQTAWPWQEKDYRENGHVPKRAVYASPRLGKSFDAALPLRDRLTKDGMDRAIITGPLVVMKQWADLMDDAGLEVVNLFDTSIAKGRELLKNNERGVVCINDDKLAHLVEELIRWDADAVIGDESHRWRGVSTKRARAARRLCWRAKFVRILTGTPAPSHYGNLWGQMVALDREAWGHSYYKDFGGRFLVFDSMFPSRVLAHKNTDELQALLLRYATIIRREDVFGPDQYEYALHPIELPERVWNIYHKLAREWIIDDPAPIETTNILSRLTRLRQIASGHLPVEGHVEMLHDEKIAAVLADLYDIVESGEKSTIFHQFRWEGAMLEEAIASTFSGVPLSTINGDNSKHGVETAARFNARDGSAVCIVQTQSGGTGISLCESEHAQVVSESFDFDAEDQALSRIYKPGMRRVVTRYPAVGTVDDYIREILTGKQNVHEAIRNADRRALAYGNIRSKRSATFGAAVKP